MSKKKIIISVLVVLLFIITSIAGKLLYLQWEKENYLGYVPAKAFTIEEQGDKKIIEHKGTRIKMEIPVDWQIEKTEVTLLLTSPDFQSSPETDDHYFYTLKKGCVTEISIIRESKKGTHEAEYDYLQARIKSCLDSPEKCKGDYPDKIIEISGQNALEFTYVPENYSEIPLGEHVFVVVPKNKNMYTFETYLFSEDREYCEQEFDKFLETVVIE